YNDIYDEPRRVLAGVTRGELVEMKLNRSKGFCCGGGGGGGRLGGQGRRRARLAGGARGPSREPAPRGAGDGSEARHPGLGLPVLPDHVRGWGEGEGGR